MATESESPERLRERAAHIRLLAGAVLDEDAEKALRELANEVDERAESIERIGRNRRQV